MQVSKHGFAVVRGQSVKKVEKNVFLTMELVVGQRQYIEVIQNFHDDYRKLRKRGFKVIDRFGVD